MKEFIVEIINKFGGRYAGSDAEKQAQLFVKDKLDAFCDEVSFLPFNSTLEAHFQALKIFVLFHLISIVLIFFSPIWAFGLSVFSSLMFICHFVTYRHCLDFLFPKKESWNVEGIIEPTSEYKQTIIFAGHIDSVKEFKWWYKLKFFGAVLTVVSSFLLALSPLFFGLIVFGGMVLSKIFLILLILLTPTLWVLFDMHGKEVVQGANDNLTGVALSYGLGKYFAQNRPKHTRIRIISFGAEEMGLRGAFAYVKANKKRLIEENALLVNLDTIKDKEHLTIATNETNTLSFFDKNLIKEMKDSFDACNMPVKTLPLTVGASDASAFKINKLQALSIIGMSSETLDPTYHTRLDNLNNLNDTAMNLTKEVMIHFVEKRDK